MSDNGNNEAQYEHHGGKWGSYVGNKRRKLVQQFRADMEMESDIFANHIIWINGRTEPPLSELKELIVSNGGTAVTTLTQNTTAMIAHNLPLTKLKKQMKASVSVCTPQWIVQSVKAKKLLDPNHFRLDRGHSTLTDPNFVSNYFKTSRLHLIGAFKQIYEEILPDLQSIKPKYDTLKCRQSQPSNESNERNIIHIDMDCYFVSVATVNKPELSHKPCVVCHSNPNKSTTHSKDSTSEISSANYVAREYGIGASMLLGKALRLCPELIVLPYAFESYVRISKQIYAIFWGYSNCVQYKSIDEAFVEFPNHISEANITAIANEMRREIFAQTQCRCSAGISHSILLAQMATKKAKPNGTFRISNNGSDYRSVMDRMSIESLPGIGRELKRKFNEKLQIFKCGDLRRDPKWSKLHNLQSEFGHKTGSNIYNSLHGIDERQIQISQKRKSVACEIGWGVRFETREQMRRFVTDLSTEVSQRMHKIGANLRAKQIQIRVKTKHQNAAEQPFKYLGHGWCNTVSRSVTLSEATNEQRMIARVCWNVLTDQLRIDHKIVRALAISATKLTDFKNENHRSIPAMFEMNGNQNQNIQKRENQKRENQNKNSNFTNALPAFSQIDSKVLDCLPRDIQRELSRAYKQRLLMANNQNKNKKNKKSEVITKLRSKFSESVVVSETKNKKKVKTKKRRVNRDQKQKKLKLISLNTNRNNCKSAQKNEIETETDNNNGAIFCEESFEEYREALLQWLRHNKAANQCHQKLLDLFIDECIEFDRLQNIVCLLKYLKRYSAKNVQWNTVSLSVIQSTQLKIQQKYKYKLQL